VGQKQHPECGARIYHPEELESVLKDREKGLARGPEIIHWRQIHMNNSSEKNKRLVLEAFDTLFSAMIETVPLEQRESYGSRISKRFLP
jgi:hypothetical protein